MAKAAKKTTAPKKTKVVKSAETKVKAPKVVSAPKAESKFKIIPSSEAAPRVHFGRSVGQAIYPFADMDVDTSFEIKADADRDLFVSDQEYTQELRSQLKTLANRMAGAVRRFTKKREGFKFSVHTGAECVVVTRVG